MASICDSFILSSCIYRSDLPQGCRFAHPWNRCDVLDVHGTEYMGTPDGLVFPDFYYISSHVDQHRYWSHALIFVKVCDGIITIFCNNGSTLLSPKSLCCFSSGGRGITGICITMVISALRQLVLKKLLSQS